MEEYYIQELKKGYDRLKGTNKYYSLRAYAAHLGLNAGSLSNILKGKRGLPLKHLEFICQKLKLKKEKKTKFMSNVFDTQSNFRLGNLEAKALETTYLDNELHFKIIAEWEHYALLNLLTTHSIHSTIPWLANRLCIKETRMAKVMENLLQEKLIEVDENGTYKRTKKKFKTSEDISSLALQKAHLMELELAYKKLTEVDIKFRDYSAIILPVNQKKLLKAKEFIRQFRGKMETLLEEGEKNEVYQLSIQLFPLTNV